MQTTSDVTTYISDRALIQAARCGKRGGFEQLVERYQDRLFVSMRNEIGCPSIAEDIVQDAFMKAFRFLDSYRCESEFYTWLYRIALNSRREYVRNRRITRSLDAHSYSFEPETRSHESPAMSSERRELRELVREAISRLEENHRTILILREFEGFDYRTIAEVLDVKMGTVRSRLARARAQLKEEIVRLENGQPVTARP